MSLHGPLAALRVLLLTGFGTGRAPVAPGTVGTLPGVVIGVLLAVGAESIWPEAAAPALALASGVLAVVLFAFGCAQGPLIRARFQSDDPGAVVLDEIVGYLIALALFAAVVGLPDPTAVVVLFAAFRVFDIAKPPPIRRLEELHGALGVMADDALAGVYAGAVAILVRQFLLA